MFGRYFAFVLLLAALPRAIAEADLQTFEGCRLVPVEWSDGDSFRVGLPDGSEQTVRIYGADCIEWHVNDESDARRLRAQRRYFGIAGGAAEESIARARGFGEAAAVRTRELLAKPFTIHTAFADGRGDSRFQRIYAFVTTADGQDLASVLVREGLAGAFGVYRRTVDGASAPEYRHRLEDLELTAATARRGIWAATDWNSLASDREAERREEEDLSAALNKKVPGRVIDPNTASRDELMSLPGVGEVLANRIIEERSAGPYTKPDDLLRVKGISPRILEAMAPALLFTKPRAGGKSPDHD